MSGRLAAAPQPNPTEVPPGPAVVSYATDHDLPLAGFESSEPTQQSRIGDRLTVLFTIQEGAASRQWLGEFRAAALTEREARSKPGSGFGLLSIFLSSLKTDTGHEFSFAQVPAALEIQTHGPFFADGSAAIAPAVTGARVLATRDYLSHGLAPMGEIELRLRAAGKKNPGLSFMFRPKYSAAQMTASTTRAQEAGFTEDDERVYAESIFALVQFAYLAFRTDGVDSIMREIADAPTLFSGAFVNLDWSRLQLENELNWSLPAATRVFRLPYNFRSKTNMNGTLFVTAARPPLQNLAGVVGLTVDWSSKTPGKRLIVHVLAGRRGPLETTDAK